MMKAEPRSASVSDFESVALDTEKRSEIVLVPDNMTLREYAAKMQEAVKIATRRWKLKTYKNCFVASEAVEWMQSEGLSENEAVQRGESLRSEGFISHVTDFSKKFANEYLFFRFHKVPTDEEVIQHVSDDWVKEMMDILDLDKSKGKWKEEKKKESCQAYSQQLPGEPVKAFKVETTTTASLESLVKLLHYEMTDRHGEWNETYAEGAVVQNAHYEDDDVGHKKVGDVNVQYWKYSMSGASDRDFCVARRLVRFPDNSVAIFDRSIDTGKYPKQHGVVRCDLGFNLRYLKTLQPGKTLFVYMNQTDIKGWIPKFVTNAVNTDVSMEEMEHVKKVCESEAQMDTV